MPLSFAYDIRHIFSWPGSFTYKFTEDNIIHHEFQSFPISLRSNNHTRHIFQTHTMRSRPIYQEILKSNQGDISGGLFAVKYQHFQCEQANCHYFNLLLKLIINKIIVNMQSVQTLTQLCNFAIVKT